MAAFLKVMVGEERMVVTGEERRGSRELEDSSSEVPPLERC